MTYNKKKMCNFNVAYIYNNRVTDLTDDHFTNTCCRVNVSPFNFFYAFHLPRQNQRMTFFPESYSCFLPHSWTWESWVKRAAERQGLHLQLRLHQVGFSSYLLFSSASITLHASPQNNMTGVSSLCLWESMTNSQPAGLWSSHFMRTKHIWEQNNGFTRKLCDWNSNWTSVLKLKETVVVNACDLLFVLVSGINKTV